MIDCGCDPGFIVIFKTNGRYIICRAAKYLIRKTASLSFAAGPTTNDGLCGSGIEVYHRSSWLCNSSHIPIIDDISSVENSSGAIREVDDKVKAYVFRLG